VGTGATSIRRSGSQTDPQLSLAYAAATGKEAAIVDRVPSRYIAAVAGTRLTRHPIVIHRIEGERRRILSPLAAEPCPPSLTLAPRPQGC
jgi:hypothetical protein